MLLLADMRPARPLFGLILAQRLLVCYFRKIRVRLDHFLARVPGQDLLLLAPTAYQGGTQLSQ